MPETPNCDCTMDQQGRCWKCREIVRLFIHDLIACGLSSEKLMDTCKDCIGGTMDEIAAEVMREFATQEPTETRRRAIAQIMNGFLMGAPLKSKKNILCELARQASLDTGHPHAEGHQS